MSREDDDKLRLKSAQEFLEYCRDQEHQARNNHRLAVESTKRAKEKYEALSDAIRKREWERIKAKARDGWE